MKIWKGLAKVFGFHRNLVWITYGVQFLLAIPLALLTYNILGDTLGASMSAERLIGEFDYVLWRDMLNHNSDALGGFLKSIGAMLPIALIITSVLACGIYSCLHKGVARVQVFLEGVRALWWRYFVISTIALVCVLFWSALVWGWYFSNLFEFLEYWKNDSHIAWLGLGLFIIWALGLYMLFIVINLAKVDQLNQKGSILNSLRVGLRNCLGASLSLSIPLIVLAMLGLVATAFYLAASSELKPSSVFALFFLQQLITWAKVGIRISAYEQVLAWANARKTNSFSNPDY